MTPDDLSGPINEIITTYQTKAGRLSRLPTNHTIPVVLLTGTATVGKSSLFNALFGGQQIAVVSSITQDQEKVEQAIWAGTFRIIDGPSYDQATQRTLDWIDRVDIVVHIYDINVRRSDRELEKRIQEHGKPGIPVLNKIDRHGKARQIAFMEKEKSVKNGTLQSIPISAHKGEGLSQLVMAVCEALPEESKWATMSQIIEIGEKIQSERLHEERLKRVKYLCEHILEDTGKTVAELGMEAFPLVDVYPIFLECQSMLQKIKQVYITEKIIEDAVNFPFGSLEQILSFVIVQEIPKLFPGAGQVAGPVTAQRIVHCIGNKAIKFYEQQITRQQVRKEIIDCIRTFPQ